jgi:tetratricopeptide (TPR) repeat protein
LFRLLDGLPLAIAQAGAFLQESRVGLGTYLEFYKQQWKELMDSRNWNSPLHDYPDRSVWTTWAISYNAIRDKHKTTANLLLLWSFLDNKDLWHGLFAEAFKASSVTKRSLLEWIGDIASHELEFTRAMQLLSNYSLIEDVGDVASYATHPVVHKWAYHYQDQDCRGKIGRLAVMVVGWAVPDESEREYWTLQRRLLPHAQACSQWVSTDEVGQSIHSHDGCKLDRNGTEEKEGLLDAIQLLGILYMDQGKLDEAAKMFKEVVEKRKRILGDEHPSTISAMNSLANTLGDQGQLDEAIVLLEVAVQRMRRIHGDEHPHTKVAVSNMTRLAAMRTHNKKKNKGDSLYARIKGKFRRKAP